MATQDSNREAKRYHFDWVKFAPGAHSVPIAGGEQRLDPGLSLPIRNGAQQVKLPPEQKLPRGSDRPAQRNRAYKK